MTLHLWRYDLLQAAPFIDSHSCCAYICCNDGCALMTVIAQDDEYLGSAFAEELFHPSIQCTHATLGADLGHAETRKDVRARLNAEHSSCLPSIKYERTRQGSINYSRENVPHNKCPDVTKGLW